LGTPLLIQEGTERKRRGWLQERSEPRGWLPEPGWLPRQPVYPRWRSPCINLHLLRTDMFYASPIECILNLVDGILEPAKIAKGFNEFRRRPHAIKRGDTENPRVNSNPF